MGLDVARARAHSSSCYIPTSWLPLPLMSRREYNYDATVYVFGLL
jgi:hypothetical protein